MNLKNNKYTTWYNRLILEASSRARPPGYTEKHHILPRSLGGSDSVSNIVHLTAKEHYIAHLLLCRMCVDKNDHFKMLNAFQMMANALHNEHRYTSRIYAVLKTEICDAKRILNSGENNPFFGKTHSDETREFIRENNKRLFSGENNPMFGRKHSQASRNKISETKASRTYNYPSGEDHPCFGKPLSEEHRRKVAAAMTGRQFSSETRVKISEGKTGEKNPNFGKVYTAIEREKMREACRGKIITDEAREEMKNGRARGACARVLEHFLEVSEETIRLAKSSGLIAKTEPTFKRIIELLGSDYSGLRRDDSFDISIFPNKDAA